MRPRLDPIAEVVASRLDRGDSGEPRLRRSAEMSLHLLPAGHQEIGSQLESCRLATAVEITADSFTPIALRPEVRLT